MKKNHLFLLLFILVSFSLSDKALSQVTGIDSDGNVEVDGLEFDKIDSDSDGFLSEAEYKPIANSISNNFDLNRDSEITEEEYLKFHADKQKGLKNTFANSRFFVEPEELKEKFSFYDEDKNKKFTNDDFFKKNFQLLMKYDENGDEKISEKDIIDHHKTIRKSISFDIGTDR